ncbi:Tyrocidine synthase 3 [compost metagenome]
MPIQNVKCAILHEGRFAAEAGEEGELLIAGIGLAREYLYQPVLTDERFQDVFQTGERWYRTGDLVKLNQDGNMEFLGRLDRQIKVRGFRVELAEIDNAIMQQEQVQNAYSTLIEDNGNRLIYSYVVAKDDDLHQDKIMAMLRDRLPDYMIPSHVIQVPNIPLTTNGKIAVDQLPKPSCPSGVEEGTGYTAGSDRISNQLNEALVQVIGSKTNIGQIDPDDNLKHHGLDSLSMIKFLVMLEELFEVEIDYFDLDELQPLTISKLHAFLLNKQE